MFEWTPRTPRSVEVRSGFEAGFFVTFVPISVEEQFIRLVLRDNPAAEKLLLNIEWLADGIQIFWKLPVQNLPPIREFAEEAQALGEELVRKAGLPKAA